MMLNPNSTHSRFTSFLFCCCFNHRKICRFANRLSNLDNEDQPWSNMLLCHLSVEERTKIVKSFESLRLLHFQLDELEDYCLPRFSIQSSSSSSSAVVFSRKRDLSFILIIVIKFLSFTLSNSFEVNNKEMLTNYQ